MAEKCVCCGKKIGLLNGSHLNNQVCDNCYFPVAGYLSSIKAGSDIEVIDENYNQFLQKIQSLPYPENGKEYLVNEVNTIVNDVKNRILTKFKTEQIRKGFKITTTNNFEEYKIAKYCGVTSGSAVLGTGFLSESRAAVSDAFGIENESFAEKLEQARSSAIIK